MDEHRKMFSGSLPLLFAMLFAIFDLIAENKLLVG